MVILIGTGWSYLKVFLAEKDKQILLIVIPLQVMAEVAIIVLDDETPAALNWRAPTALLLYHVYTACILNNFSRNVQGRRTARD